jgi:hypothetical protein
MPLSAKPGNVVPLWYLAGMKSFTVAFRNDPIKVTEMAGCFSLEFTDKTVTKISMAHDMNQNPIWTMDIDNKQMAKEIGWQIEQELRK